MSSSILRRNSSKQGLQNLLRVTAQRSVEDAEEIQRERRRRAREMQQGEGTYSGPTSPTSPTTPTTPSNPSNPSQDDGLLARDTPCESDLKPGSRLAFEEDEGFSDWTQRLEKRKQRHLEEQGAREDQQPSPNETSRSSHETVPQHEEEEEEQEWERRTNNKTQEASSRVTDDKGTEKKKELKISYTSKVFMPQEMRHMSSNGHAAGVERTSYLVAGKMSPSRSGSLADQAEEVDGEVAEAFQETEQRLERFRRSHAEKETQELEELRLRQTQEQQELEELNLRRDERRRVREEEERRREEEGQRRQVQEETERQRMREEIERRRMEATERRMKNLSVSSNEGDEPQSPFSPISPTFKNETEERVTADNTCTITERTESLNRSLKKSNSIKKTLPSLPISKIDNRLEQYTHAIETSSKDAKAVKQALMDLPSPTEPVASKKNLFEAGDAWSLNATKGPPSKDAEGIKVGVADLINQWVKGNPDESGKSPTSKPTEVKPGDVLNKKNLWENLGDPSSSGRLGGGRGTSGKRYKFVVTGHGKYEKVAVNDDDDYSDDTNGKSTGQCLEDL